MTPVVNVDYPYVERNKSRHGTYRYYLRIDGKRICRLPDDVSSEDFAKAYWKARNDAESALGKKAPPSKLAHLSTRQGTFQWLCMAYMKSQAYAALDTSTQERRRSIMESMWEEPLSQKNDRRFGDMPLTSMDVGNITVLRDRKKDVPFAANERLKTLRQVFDTKGADGKPLTANYARLVEPFRVHSDGHATATPEELENFISHHGTGSKAVLYLAIGMYTGLRVSDLAVLGPQHRRGNMFRLRLFKNRNRTPVDIELALHPILEGVLATHEINALTYLTTDYGKPFSIKGLGNRISDWFRQAGLSHLTSHSVRKGAATDAAHNEATDSMLEAMFGWRDGKTSKIYTRQAERARLARQTVARINWDGIGTKLIAAGGETENE